MTEKQVTPKVLDKTGNGKTLVEAVRHPVWFDVTRKAIGFDPNTATFETPEFEPWDIDYSEYEVEPRDFEPDLSNLTLRQTMAWLTKRSDVTNFTSGDVRALREKLDGEDDTLLGLKLMLNEPTTEVPKVKEANDG